MSINNNYYYVGQIPSRPIAINVKDSNGAPTNLSGYTAFNAICLGSDNEVIDLTGSTLLTSGAAEGRFVFRWPTGTSVFTKPGQYVLQLEIVGTDTIDYTTEHNIFVRRLGGKN